jgi:predicted metal-dependent hydrolase
VSRYSRRALPPYRHRPGQTPHPERDPAGYRYGRPELDAAPLEEGGWQTNDAYLHGVDLFNALYFWEAHAAWEAAWNVTPRDAPASLLLQALVQLAAAFLKRELETPAGASKLLGRAAEKLSALETATGGGRYLGIDLARLRREAEAGLASGQPSPRIELSA